MTAAEEILVRVDAGPVPGLGHAMRCLALAQGWQDSGGSAAFLMAETLPVMEACLRKEGIETIRLRAAVGSDEDAQRTSETATQLGAAWIVVDGYRFRAEYQHALKVSSHRVLAFDDYGHTGHCSADLVLNQNPGVLDALYADREPGTYCLLGRRYILLQREFRTQTRTSRTIVAHARKILVTFGSVDAANVMLTVLQSLSAARIPDPEVHVVVGSANPNLKSLEAAAAAARGHIELERDPESLVDQMAWADMAVAGAGTTSYELAHMGVPSLLVVLADNQGGVGRALDAAGAARNLGWYEDLTPATLAQAIEELASNPATREAMSKRGQELVDGQGVSRVVTNLKAGLITLRRAQEEDARLLWEWANDPSVRSVSFTQDPIAWADHLRWFQAKRKDPRCLFYVGTDSSGTPIGQIRFDSRDDEAEVSVSLDARHRAHGQGSALILAGSRKVFATSRVRTLHAYIREGNEPSVRAFTKAGYIREGTAVVHGESVDHFVLTQEGSG